MESAEDTGTAGSVAEAEESVQDTNPEDITGTVVIWDWDGGTQQKYVDKFNEVYPNVTVEVQDVAWDLSLIHICADLLMEDFERAVKHVLG